MYNYIYVSKKHTKPIKKEIIRLLNLIQNEIRDKFTFRYDFVGSESHNMVTMDEGSNIGFDFDVNIRVNDEEQNYTAKEIKEILINAFNKFLRKYGYDYCENSTRVITIKVKDYAKSKILHSCDFAIVNDYVDDNDYQFQEYIRFKKGSNTYTWETQPDGFYQLSERIEYCKDNNLWQDVRDLYIEKKNNNVDKNKKSRSIFAETINEIYNQNYED